MNDSPDDLVLPNLDIDASNGAIDTGLAADLHAYFVMQRTPPPDPEAFWQRLAPYLEAHTSLTTPSALAVATPPDKPPGSERRERHVRTRRNSSSPSRLRRGISNAAAVAAVLLLSLGALALFHQFGLVASNGQTIQRGHLVWHTAALPPGVILEEGVGVTERSSSGQSAPAGTPANATPNATLAVAQANGDVAYICQVPSDGAALLWRTIDAGRHWALLPDLPSSGPFMACGMQTDANNALTVMVMLESPSQETTKPTVYVLFDGTTRWRLLPEGVNTFVSSHGRYYAIRNSAGTAGQQVQGHLYVSTDQMSSWRPIDAPLIAESLAAAKRLKLNGATGVEQFWVSPDSSELLAQTYDGVLWRSSTHGASWVQIKLPALPPAVELTPTPGEQIMETGMPGAAIVVVQQPIADHPFTLCALILDQTLTVFNVAPLYCSTDSGQTWKRFSQPAISQGNGKPDQFELPSLMLPDGSLLSWDVTTIYRMPGSNLHAPSGYAVGMIPPPHDPNDIPGGMAGTTVHGVTLWQPYDTRTLYVAHYSVSSGSRAS
jgi:hypothetical protein